MLPDISQAMRDYETTHSETTPSIYRKVSKHVGWLARHEAETMDHLKQIGIVDFETDYCPSNFVQMIQKLRACERTHAGQYSGLHHKIVNHIGWLARHKGAYMEYLLRLGILLCSLEAAEDASPINA